MARKAVCIGRILLPALALLAGCRAPGAPRFRSGRYPTATPWMRFIGLEDLGRHGYASGRGEGNGIVYTCAGGHVDIAHVRSTADWTRYLAERVLATIRAGATAFTFGCEVDASRYAVTLRYPGVWSEDPRAAWDAAVAAGQYLTFTIATWHEALTWFGHRSVSLLSEFPSAFSWEDTYSNALGVTLAGRVLASGIEGYDARMTAVLHAELVSLAIQPRDTARTLTAALAGDWYRGRWPGFVDMRRRSFDVGAENGVVTPVRVPGAAPCADTPAHPCPVPTRAAVTGRGLDIRLTIEPRERVRHRLLRLLAAPDQPPPHLVVPARDLPVILDAIRREATRRGMTGGSARLVRGSPSG